MHWLKNAPEKTESRKGMLELTVLVVFVVTLLNGTRDMLSLLIAKDMIVDGF